MGVLLRDLRFGMRALFKRPGSSGVAVLAFGLGIGLCTVMFTIIYGIFFRGIGVPEEDRLVIVWRTNAERGVDRSSVHQHDFYDWRESQTSFEGLAGFTSGTVNVSDADGPRRYDGGFVTANLFDILRVRPILGSGFREGDDRAGAPLTVVLGYDAWVTQYRSDPQVVGRTVKINGEQGTIVGVMPDGFMFPETQEVWIPRRDERGTYPRRGTGVMLQTVGRLRDGVSVEQAELEMNVIASRLAEEYPESNAGWTVRFGTFSEQAIGDEAVPVLAAMQAATFFVLLIACANVANLLLARAATRTKEAAVRTALGASRLRVAMPFFGEAIALAVAGAAVGTMIAVAGITWFDGATTGVGKPYFMVFTLDLPILGFILAVTVVTALISGAAPALQIGRSDVNAILKDESRGASSMRAGRMSKVLVVGEVALSCALLVGAGLMTKSITQLSRFEYPFRTEGMFTARVALFESDFPTPESRARFWSDLEERLAALPPARMVALTDRLPGTTSGTSNFGIEGRTYATDEDYPRARNKTITPDYFDVFGVSVLQGRTFTEQDDSVAPGVAIVNESFARRYFPDESPIGRRIRPGNSSSEAEWLNVVGVVPDLKMEGLDPSNDTPAGFYTAFAQQDRRFMSVAINVGEMANPVGIASEVRAAVRSVHPDTPIYFVLDLPGVIHEEVWFYSVFGSLFIVFGAAALFMASVGLYGVLAFSVSRRVQEMGLRMALGADARSVVGLVLREGGWQVGIGLGLGLVLSFFVSNVVSILLFNVEPRDPLIFSLIPTVILIVGAVASFIPARRATRVDPMVALRYE